MIFVNKKKQVSRKYYYYNADCECCSGDTHFEIVYYCKDCKPIEPIEIRPFLASIKFKKEQK